MKTLLPAILYNMRAAPWVKDVHTMADLLDGAYKGKFATTPYLAGFDVLLSDEMWGIEKSKDFVRRLSGQVSGFIICSSGDRIASGEIPALALDCDGNAQNTAKFRDK